MSSLRYHTVRGYGRCVLAGRVHMHMGMGVYVIRKW